jgi:hypothetical protein
MPLKAPAAEEVDYGSVFDLPIIRWWQVHNPIVMQRAVLLLCVMLAILLLLQAFQRPLRRCGSAPDDAWVGATAGTFRRRQFLPSGIGERIGQVVGHNVRQIYRSTHYL